MEFEIILNFILNISVWAIDRTLIGTICLGQNKPGSDDNEKVALQFRHPAQEPHHWM